MTCGHCDIPLNNPLAAYGPPKTASYCVRCWMTDIQCPICEGKDETICEECAGTGDCQCDCGDRHDCGHCKGEGRIKGRECTTCNGDGVVRLWRIKGIAADLEARGGYLDLLEIVA